MTTQMFVTVPKYVAISPSPLANGATSSGALTDDDETISIMLNEPSTCRAKKRRLDHLTWEEKLQRKKLKNRVAAQTSRDRKKARMEEMESTISMLTDKAELLQNKCDSLQSINNSLLEKNQKLDNEVESLRKQIEELQKSQMPLEKSMDCAELNSILNGSAVSNLNPLPQGIMEYQSTAQRQFNHRQYLNEESVATLWKIVALCLLYKTCSKISTPLNLKNLPRAYSQISRQSWKEVIQKATQMLPKKKATQSGCLDQWWGPHQKSWNPANISTESISV